ncbi:MAG: polyprenyl diphosphate synthase [Candidatus Heimdallarchaeota archaeon]
MRNLLYSLYERRLWRQIKNGPQPHHIGIIMDGNRRFARRIGLASHLGHKYGVEKLREVLRWCWELEVGVVTLYTFSSENFNRSNVEINTIMDLASDNFLKLADEPEIHNKNVRIKAIGRRNRLPKDLQKAIQHAEDATKHYTERTIQIAISYGGREEIIDAIRNIVHLSHRNGLVPETIDENLVASYLYTNGIPDPDLVIRTSGEERLSGFMLWQTAYSELVFLDVFWPIMRKIDLWRAIRTFQQRERRHGN